MKETIILAIRKFRVRVYKLIYSSAWSLGAYTQRIGTYDQALIEKLRFVYYGGMPASIILMVQPLCKGNCYDRASMLSLGLDKFDLVWGSIMRLRSGPSIVANGYSELEDSDHCWVESGGWVYDTSHCLKYKKWFYYLIERPIVRRRKDQDWCRSQPYYQEMLEDSVKIDIGLLPIIVPLIEPHVKKSVYGSRLESEFELFKDRINYHQIRDEFYSDMIAKGFKTVVE